MSYRASPSYAVGGILWDPSTGDNLPAPWGWRCFHCSENFTHPRAARLHFGETPFQKPICLTVSEKGMVSALRDAEKEVQEAWDMVHQETTDVHRALYRAHSRHQRELVRAEQLGYDRGLADGRKEQVE